MTGTRSDAPQGDEALTLVVKIGSAVLMRRGSELDRGAFCRLVEALALIITSGQRVVLVTSGAVAMGRQKLRLDKRPTGERSIPKLQALAAMGQSRLMQLYEAEFAHYNLHVAQVLLTRDDFNHRQRYLNARHALDAIHGFGAVPIINENDSVGTEEIRFGDNDQLAAMVAAMISADQLIILSDIDGLYTGNPATDREAERIVELRAADPSIDDMIGDKLDSAGFGTGGMRTKIAAARMAARTGIVSVIAPGKAQGVLEKVLAGDESVGTRLTPEPGVDRLAARKTWIGTGLMARGRVWCDEGAARAIKDRGTSLLPSGVTRVEGAFAEGEAVELLDAEGEVFARGLATYSAQAMRQIAGHQSAQIEDILGYRVLDAVIHRDDLVLS